MPVGVRMMIFVVVVLSTASKVGGGGCAIHVCGADCVDGEIRGEDVDDVYQQSDEDPCCFQADVDL